MRKFWLGLLLLFPVLTACSNNPGPVLDPSGTLDKICKLCPVPPTPTPQPPVEIVKYLPVCDPDKNLVFGCWHNPTGEKWEYIPCKACEVCKECPPDNCPPENPLPPSSSCVPDPNDPKWGPPVVHPFGLMAEYATVIKAVGTRCGFADATEKPQNETLDLIAKEWKKQYNRCASRWADAVAVEEEKNLFAEIHAVYFGNGCIIDGANAYKGSWPYLGGIVSDCGYPPCPLKTYEDGRPHWSFNSHLYGNNMVDTTPATVDQLDYCTQTKFSPKADGTLRADCPLGPDLTPERKARELYILGGHPILDSRNGAACSQNPENEFQFYVNGGNCRLCNVDKTVCTGWY